MISINSNQGFIDAVIAELDQEYQATQGLILSESDLKGLVFQKLYRNFSEPLPTLNPKYRAISLHTEIPWYDENNKLSIRPDITILNPQLLNITRSITVKELPSKGFEFVGPATVIELKFIRRKNGIMMKDILTFQKDIEKIIGLSKRGNRPEGDNQIRGIVVIFNKTSRCVQSFKDFLLRFEGNPLIEIYYCTGNVDY